PPRDRLALPSHPRRRPAQPPHRLQARHRKRRRGGLTAERRFPRGRQRLAIESAYPDNPDGGASKARTASKRGIASDAAGASRPSGGSRVGGNDSRSNRPKLTTQTAGRAKPAPPPKPASPATPRGPHGRRAGRRAAS